MINDRIAYLIKDLGINPNRFAEQIEVNSTVIHNIIKGRRSKPSYEVLQKIIRRFEHLNSDWLLRGTGNLWKAKTSTLQRNQTEIKYLETRLLHLIRDVQEHHPEVLESYEMMELITTVIDENDKQRKKMVKIQERQDEIIKTLARMKKVF